VISPVSGYNTDTKRLRISIAIIPLNGTDASKPGDIWVGLMPPHQLDPLSGPSEIAKLAVLYTRALQLQMGAHTFAWLDLAERRTISPLLADMVGLKPVCHLLSGWLYT
jgi:hypothetical protein